MKLSLLQTTHPHSHRSDLYRSKPGAPSLNPEEMYLVHGDIHSSALSYLPEPQRPPFYSCLVCGLEGWWFFCWFFFLKPRLKHLRSERDRVQRGRVKTRCCLKSCILAAIRIKKGYGKTTKRPPPLPLLPPKSTDFVFHMRANKDVRNDGGVRHGKRGQPTEGLPNSSRKGAFTAIHDLYERTMK